ncbi:hypothetical protein HYX01_04820, partial [Candidatus Woesearchaeota archaeon]|nr:hypothetical protein [Candidatus Woesearchaeota archaeon]
MGKNKIKIGLIQSEVEKGIDRNLEKTERLAKEASSKGADIVCLQELFAMKYFAQTKNKGFFKFAEHTPGRITNFLSETAKRNKIVLIGSLFEKNIGGKYYNTCLIFDENGKIICKYRKIHVPYDPCYYEQFYFSNGNLGFVQCTAKGVKIAPLICYDQWFPEAARVNAVNGAKIIFYPTAIGWIEEMKKNE